MGGAEAELGRHSAGLRGNHLTPLVAAAAAARDTPGSADLGPRSASVCETQSTDLEPPHLPSLLGQGGPNISLRSVGPSCFTIVVPSRAMPEALADLNL